MIRKTSLLRKIGPIARRSSFATKIIYNPLTSLILRRAAMNERRNDLEIRNESPRIASQIPNSDRSPLYDVRYHARRYSSEQRVRSDVSRTIVEAFSNFDIIWWSQTGSNRRPHACKARALPAELWPRTRRRMLRTRSKWWAWEDLNFRPHAYQARALTN